MRIKDFFHALLVFAVISGASVGVTSSAKASFPSGLIGKGAN